MIICVEQYLQPALSNKLCHWNYNLQIRAFGFSDVIGQVSFPEEESREIGRRPYSQRLAASIDEEASKLIFSAYKKTEEVLKANMDKLRLVSIFGLF